MHRDSQCHTVQLLLVWTDLEETPGYFAGSGYFIRGAQCTGYYCDNLSFYVCKMN